MNIKKTFWLQSTYKFVFSNLGNCRKLLDSGSITEHDGEMFCSSCYRKNFGPKGYGFGGGSGTLSMDDGKGYTVSSINHMVHKNFPCRNTHFKRALYSSKLSFYI